MMLCTFTGRTLRNYEGNESDDSEEADHIEAGAEDDVESGPDKSDEDDENDVQDRIEANHGKAG